MQATTTVQGALHSPTVQPNIHRATTSVIESRKTWKSLKASKEYVWPPHVERALIEGLEKYRPTSSANPKALKRFPKRNRWIADHIFRITGASRTAKQVGSRLQQLRDTCQDDRIKTLLSRREYSPEAESMASSSEKKTFSSRSSRISSSYSTTLTSREVTTEMKLGADHQQEQKCVLHPPTRTSVTIEVQSSDDEEINTRGVSHLPIIDTDSCEVTVYASQPLKQIAPIISFATSTFICIRDYHSSFRVFHGNERLYSESTEISLESSSSMSSKVGTGTVGHMHVYRSKFIPRFWDNLGKTVDIFQCMILHEIVRKSSHTSQSDDGSGIADVLFTVVYQFRPAPAPSISCPNRVLLEHAGTGVGLYSLVDTQVAAQPSAEASFTASLANAPTASLEGSEYVRVPESMVSVEGNQPSRPRPEYRAYPGDISASQSTSMSTSPQEGSILSSQQSPEPGFPDGYQTASQDFAFQSDGNHDGIMYLLNGAANIPIFQGSPQNADTLGLPVDVKQLWTSVSPQDGGAGDSLGDLPRDDPNCVYFWATNPSYSTGGMVHAFQYNTEPRFYQLQVGHCGISDGGHGYYRVHSAPSNNTATVSYGQFASAGGPDFDYSSFQAQMPSVC
ncbi:hypothetical protein Moror_1108 [Moniliophthora roreri MCA 2997]|uniref:TEA domain-containing protein n=2 Tax=Moniliophthora roreri TaxID=221103 RepID=V2XHJ2_MONRO|nr:hypothetical protein Moror_1108 [Moniliophthora roreri MCA 2997]KAI3598505.1 hypothetical protein WG66_017124 [Moniliophthora roreri]